MASGCGNAWMPATREAFQNYVVSSVRHLATLKSAFFMVDDDYRMLTGRNGCYCEIHIAEFNGKLWLTRTAVWEPEVGKQTTG